MMVLFSNDFWIAILFFISFFLVIFLFVLVKKINRLNLGLAKDVHGEDEFQEDVQLSKTASHIIEKLEPFMQEAGKTAAMFDEQIKEKKRLLKELNDALDNRIININLLLSRAETRQKKILEQHTAMVQSSGAFHQGPFNAGSNNFSADTILDQQHRIVQMYNQQIDTDTIARKLSIPRGEVKLVIDLKKKFLEMEKNNP